MRRLAAAALSLVAASVLVSGCSSGTPQNTGDNSATGSGTLRIGIADDLPGVSLKTDSGYAGFDIDTANYVAGKLGVPTKNITWQRIDQAERVSAVTSGKVDLVVSTFSITPEREKEIAFAGPYFVAHQDLLIRRNDDTITGPETLDGKKVCAAAGTTSIDYLTSHYQGKITVVKVPSWSECVRDLAAGTVDAVSTDDLILAGFATQPEYKGVLRVIGKGFTDENYGIGLKQGDDRLEKVRAALKEYISSGAWKKSLDANIAPSGYGIPAPPTVK
ncbi:MAG: glutamate-binding protein [Microbacterium sp. 14-71-5]|jgi:glutamate transport system substrate-binding protein|uniref:glutamate ABC transporter substrate-binding protein n=1 Tax=Microbacterium sp. 13-71-7 TaxID=1970399 RepID=UPI000BC9A792|nr:glutamate ABC transporter substrate-binding protein [Microbacterium sp. 13-71-7]OZB85774.1 MAG: glutamate-binding protein [Microbacterium sp. 13-71-7]OZB88101.1 MAG: glutamate-binding protein [Microbacterium sp. 14-71-5]